MRTPFPYVGKELMVVKCSPPELPVSPRPVQKSCLVRREKFSTPLQPKRLANQERAEKMAKENSLEMSVSADLSNRLYVYQKNTSLFGKPRSI